MPRTNTAPWDYYRPAGQSTEAMTAQISAVDTHLADREAERQVEPADVKELRENVDQAWQSYLETRESQPEWADPEAWSSAMLLAKSKMNFVRCELNYAVARWRLGRAR